MNPVCHGEKRSDVAAEADALVAIHLNFQLDCRARPAGLAMTNPFKAEIQRAAGRAGAQGFGQLFSFSP
jgi:hypothetical protein